MDESGHEIGHNLMALSLELRVKVVLCAVIHLDLSIQRCNLLLMLFLASLQLSNVSMIDVTASLEVGALPLSESFVLDQPVNSLNRSEQKDPRLLEPLDIADPCIHSHFSQLLFAHLLEPNDLAFYVFLAFNFSDLGFISIE